jgi:hypothetical protein
MKWADKPAVMLEFDKWITNQSNDLGDFLKELLPHIPKNDTTLLFVTFAKFSHLYTVHRSMNPNEDLTLSFHRVINTLMEEESTRQLFARMMQNGVNRNLGVE